MNTTEAFFLTIAFAIVFTIWAIKKNNDDDFFNDINNN